MFLHSPPSELCPLSLSAEDILDEVSGLTVDSVDDSFNGGPRLTPQSPGDHQQDKTCTGTGQKVGYVRANTQLSCVHTPRQTQRCIHATEQGINSLVV